VRLERYDEVLKAVDEGMRAPIKDRETTAQLYLSRGVVYVMRGKYDAAIKNLTGGIELGCHDCDWLIYANRSYCYLQKGQIEPSLKDANAALKRADGVLPSSLSKDSRRMLSVVYQNRASMLVKKDDRKRARADYEKALRWNPENKEAALSLAALGKQQ